MTFEQVKTQLKKGLYIKKGVPDARYGKQYKYTLYYAGSNNVCKVCKTLKEVIEMNDSVDNLTI